MSGDHQCLRTLVSRRLPGALLLPGALGSGVAAPSRHKLHGEERSTYFSPKRENLLPEGVPESLSPRRLSSSEHLPSRAVSVSLSGLRQTPGSVGTLG